MAKEKSGKGGSLTSGIGMCSTKSNPLPQPSRTSSQAGPGSNSDQGKVNSLLQRAHQEKDSLRGKSGM